MTIQYIYEAEFIELMPDGQVRLFVDLGFSIRASLAFRVTDIEMSDEIRDMVAGSLRKADEILVKSYKQELYWGDITYRIGDRWYNLMMNIQQAVRHNA